MRIEVAEFPILEVVVGRFRNRVRTQRLYTRRDLRILAIFGVREYAVVMMIRRQRIDRH